MPPDSGNADLQREQHRIDREAALRRLGGDERLFADIVGFFREDAPPLLRSLQDAIRDRDPDQIARSAHSLKGLAANLGDDALIDAALAVERAARARQLALAEGLSAKVAEELRKTLSELRGEPEAAPDSARSGGIETTDAAE
jgi:HPt (histidine-containing phosphotransfer) domain-containing protein